MQWGWVTSYSNISYGPPPIIYGISKNTVTWLQKDEKMCGGITVDVNQEMKLVLKFIKSLGRAGSGQGEGGWWM